ncbi:MAG: hypothetical protein GY798_15935, partial [Hyphomicrobiales bacterium]|nr:hypothetical protein [Hyphomicrobiales bacterium]
RRTVYRFEFCDQVIQTVMADWLRERASAELSPALYSYRPGMACHQAVHAAAHYLVQHRRSRSDPHRRGVYVLRRDVKSYFDAVPVADDGRVWMILKRLLGTDGDPIEMELVQRAVRPFIRIDDHSAQLTRGLPTGSPVANEIANVYLSEMDWKLARVAGGFYARYGDDVLAMHAERTTAMDMATTLHHELEGSGLCWNEEKGLDLFLTAAGRPDPTAGLFLPAGEFEFLGHRIDGRGTVSLPARKTRALLGSLRRRAMRAAGGENNATERLRRITTALNVALDPREPAAHPVAKAIRNAVTDRGYLKWLDREIALIAGGAAFGCHGVRALRRVSPRELHQTYGLRSVTAMRNALAVDGSR